MKMQDTKELNQVAPTSEQRLVLCAANAYEQKYWLNPLFDKIPDSIKEELRTVCILFTQEAGGVFMLVFDEEGALDCESFAEADDITYDNVSAGLLTGRVRMRRQDMFHMLELFYRIYILHENPTDVLVDDED